MKIRNGIGKYAQRKAISPIIATVLIIAVTLIAAVAIGGFVFGIFGSSSNSANVSVTQQSLLASAVSGFNAAGSGAASTTFTCNVAAGNTLTFGLAVSNTGTAAASVTGITITYAGAVTSFTPAAADPTCTVAAAGLAGTLSNGNPMYLNFIGGSAKITPQPTSGQTYTGTVTMSNGAVLIFTGSFE